MSIVDTTTILLPRNVWSDVGLTAPGWLKAGPQRVVEEALYRQLFITNAHACLYDERAPCTRALLRNGESFDGGDAK